MVGCFVFPTYGGISRPEEGGERRRRTTEYIGGNDARVVSGHLTRAEPVVQPTTTAGAAWSVVLFSGAAHDRTSKPEEVDEGKALRQRAGARTPAHETGTRERVPLRPRSIRERPLNSTVTG